MPLAFFKGHHGSWMLVTNDAQVLEMDATAETKHPVCPWCWEPVAETRVRDAVFRGVAYIGRTYRCDGCALTLYANQDARPA